MSEAPRSRTAVYLTESERQWVEKRARRTGARQTDVLRLALRGLMHTTRNRGLAWLEDELEKTRQDRRTPRAPQGPQLTIID